MNINKIALLSFLLGIVSFVGEGQTAIQGNAKITKLTLTQAVETALQHNLNVRSYEVNLQNAELTYQQAKYNQLPH